MRMLQWGFWLLMGCACAAPAMAADKVDEKTLQAIRQALVEAAMNANTRVSAHSWMDTQGALREVNRFTSDIQLQGLKVRGNAAAPEVEVLGVQRLANAPAACRVPSARANLRQMMTVQLSTAPELSQPASDGPTTPPHHPGPFADPVGGVDTPGPCPR